MKCPNCEKVLQQTEGKRQKRFCNSTCRSNFWQKQQTLKKASPTDISKKSASVISEKKLLPKNAQDEVAQMIWEEEQKILNNKKR